MSATKTWLNYPKVFFFFFVFAALGFGKVGALGLRPAWAVETYFNSSEPGCDGSNPNYLMCDDFEDGTWYVTTGDFLNTPNDGWGGTVYANPVTPPNAAECGGKGVAGTDCAATSGPKLGSIGGKNMAKHNFAPNVSGYTEIYVRYYYKAASGYLWGQQKALTFNLPNGSGIKWGTLIFNNGAGAALSSNGMVMGFANIPQAWGNSSARIDVGTSSSCGVFCLGPGGGGIDPGLQIQSGRWYALQVHIKLNTLRGTRNGVFEFWSDDCGTNGLGCTGTPTKRFSRSDIDYDRTTSSELLGNVWIENWANPGSTGTEYYDQIIVSKTGPIPFTGANPPGPPPPPSPGPSGLTVSAP